MAEMVFFRGFLEARSKVASERLRKRIDRMLYTIRDMPGVGSTLSASRYSHGKHADVKVAIVNPYVIVYEYDKAKDTVYVHNLMHGKMAK